MTNRRCCNTCKKNIFGKCDILKTNDVYKKLLEDKKSTLKKEVYNFKEKFICEEYKSKFIEYPIEVSKINSDTEIFTLNKNVVGKFVKIRPCGDKYNDKTFLGLYLGDLPVGNSISHNSETKELNVSFQCNPAVFVFELNEIIYGYQSWWEVIESEEDLKDISDNDIDNVWYVKALKLLQ